MIDRLINTSYYPIVNGFAGAIENLTGKGSRPAASSGETRSGRASHSGRCFKEFSAKGTHNAKPDSTWKRNDAERAATSLDTILITDESPFNPLPRNIYKRTNDPGPRGETCGQWYTLICKRCEKAHPERFYKPCGNRIRCRTCRKRWQYETKKRFRPVIAAMKRKGRVRLLTLTAKDGPVLATNKKQILDFFKTLRQRKLWKDNVWGGIRVLETKRGKYSRLWHSHLHILYVGNFISQEELSKVWNEITGGSSIVDIRLAYGNVEQELFKYTVKDAGLDPEDFDEVEAALKNCPVVMPFGCMYNLQRSDEETAGPMECPHCHSIGTLIPECVFKANFASKKAA